MSKRIFILLIFILFSQNAFSEIPFKAASSKIINERSQFLTAPKWSPDGQYIAAAGDNFGSIWLYNVKTDTWTKLVEQNGAGWEFAWSPDSRKIAFRANKIERRRKQTTIQCVDIGSGKIAQLIDYDREFSTPKWVTNNDVAFLHHNKYKSVTIATKTLSRPNASQPQKSVTLFSSNGILTKEKNKDISMLKPLQGRAFDVAYSPDESRILFKKQGREIFVMQHTGKDLKQIAKGEMPVWGPSGKYVLYAVTRENQYQYISSDLFIVDAEGRENKQITFSKNELEMRPDWSPDGKQIACDSNGKIILIDLIGSVK